MNKNILSILIISIILTGFQQLMADGQNNPNTNRGAGRNKQVWTPTNQQNELPSIIIKGIEGLIEYSFQSLIEADGYLCPGSARCYMTLNTALPILYKDSEPILGDFKIIYGPSDCADRVYKFFMGDEYQSEEYLYSDESSQGREQTIIRISTGEQVHIVYNIPAADGHTPEGATAGDFVLNSTDGKGMKVSINTEL